MAVVDVAAHAAPHEEHRTSTGLNSRKLVFWAFLGSECMFFGSLIATYLVYRGRDQVGSWSSFCGTRKPKGSPWKKCRRSSASHDLPPPSPRDAC